MSNQERKAYLIGGGIASLSAAVYLIKDGGLDGRNINILEETDDLGGSLDGKGSADDGYITRGGRMFSEEVYNCTFDLLSNIPKEKGSIKTLLDDFKEFNKDVHVKAGARLVEKGKIIDSTDLGLSIIDRVGLLNLLSLPESFFEGGKIDDYFSANFFKTNFWFMWATTFAFQPWHSIVEFKRYLLRFIQEFPRIHTMTGVRHTRYNQYDSIIYPTSEWLKERGVNFIKNCHVSDIKFAHAGEDRDLQVEKIVCSTNDRKDDINIGDNDLVFFTNGSMTTNSTLGSTKEAPKTNDSEPTDSWALWKKLARNHQYFGRPHAFMADINKMKWESFSVTLRDKKFIDLIKKFSGNEPGTGGIITFKDSNWLLSVAIPNQPHFPNQPDDVYFFGIYGLTPDKEGNFVQKNMSECSGEEILIETCNLLGLSTDIPEILKNATIIPCMLPYITSQFMPRKKRDRPEVLPKGTRNFAFIGQFVEVHDEIVFTVEQSVRSAMIAVYGLLGIQKEIPPIYKGIYDPEVMIAFSKALFGMDANKFKFNDKIELPI